MEDTGNHFFTWLRELRHLCSSVINLMEFIFNFRFQIEKTTTEDRRHYVTSAAGARRTFFLGCFRGDIAHVATGFGTLLLEFLHFRLFLRHALNP